MNLVSYSKLNTSLNSNSLIMSVYITGFAKATWHIWFWNLFRPWFISINFDPVLFSFTILFHLSIPNRWVKQLHLSLFLIYLSAHSCTWTCFFSPFFHRCVVGLVGKPNILHETKLKSTQTKTLSAFNNLLMLLLRNVWWFMKSEEYHSWNRYHSWIV